MGFYQPTRGKLLVNGEETVDPQPAGRAAAGIGMVYQHFTLVPCLTAAENMVISRADVPAVIDWRKEIAALDGFMDRMPFRVPLNEPVVEPVGGREAEARNPQAALSRPALPDPRRADLGADAGRGRRGARACCATWRSAGDITVLMITHKFREVTAFCRPTSRCCGAARYAGGGSVARALDRRDVADDDRRDRDPQERRARRQT